MSVEVLDWKNVKNDVLKYRPELAYEINKISRSRNFSVIKAAYPFNSPIIRQGEFYVHQNGRSVLYNSASISKEIKSILNYNWRSIPFGMVNKGSFESHVAHSTHIAPFVLKKPGSTFSLLTVFEEEHDNKSNFPTTMYSASSGCRSLVLLPRLTNKRCLQNLQKRLGLSEPLSDHERECNWGVLSKIYSAASQSAPWFNELYFFSHDFINTINETVQLRHRLLKSAWDAIAFRRHSVTYEFLWSIFVNSLPLSEKNNIRAIGTVRHILMILMKQAPGYAPVSSDGPGPLQLMTEILISDYGLKYRPNFMCPELFDYKGTTPSYYSLYNHSFFYKLDCASSKVSANEVASIRSIFLKLKDFILDCGAGYDLSDTILHHALETTELDFYHPKGVGDINRDIIEIFNQDKRFFTTPGSNKELNKMPPQVNSPFFHGCIRLKSQYFTEYLKGKNYGTN